MRELFGLTAAVVVVIGLASPVMAYCLVPDQPRCASRYGKFEDEFEFSRCRREVETMRSETETAMQCLRDQFDETVQGFNKRARSTD
ncbi:hypothetical protein [Bosea sp. RAC05]|uniref:hypothetical protein n=1 Tax=Bosea sp. RAC05 TaxID=1842539 RepID=UPI00083DA57E|nr:hypothetical protein [Bosea sp. RAC05]AOG04284.1 hypothetical protein BSY19_2679 [Bosea sp. RAC05]